MTWTAFRDTAAELDVRASLSIPLFAGSGRTLAALNLYSRRPSSMAGLTAAAWAAYDPAAAGPWRTNDLDSGCRELASGLIGARAMRKMIQLAIAVLVSPTDHGTELAYQTLCTRAADAGTSLTDTAALIVEQRPS